MQFNMHQGPSEARNPPCGLVDCIIKFLLTIACFRRKCMSLWSDTEKCVHFYQLALVAGFAGSENISKRNSSVCLNDTCLALLHNTNVTTMRQTSLSPSLHHPLLSVFQSKRSPNYKRHINELALRVKAPIPLQCKSRLNAGSFICNKYPDV